jgi:peptide/nickel transport system permease protein
VRSRRYLLKKTIHAVATLAFVLTLNFFLFRVMPGDPAKLLARSKLHLNHQQTEALIREFGLDKPLWSQFLHYFPDTLSGHLGVSFVSNRPITAVVGERIWPTVLLVGMATLVATIIGLLIGIRGAWRRGSAFDTGSLLGSLVLYSMPEGWLGMILLILFGGALGWFPVQGWESATPASGLGHLFDVLNHLFLPCMTLVLGYLGEYAIIMRSSLLEVMGEDFITTARAKGVPDRLVRRRHAVPNALLPSLTLVFYSFGFVLGGSVIVEEVYSWPGLGQLTYQAINSLDYPVIQAIFLLFSAAVIVFNLFADILYGYLDPRVTEG